MARVRNKLKTRTIGDITDPGRHSDGGGLYLAVTGEGEAQSRRWVFMFTRAGKRREMGLGAFPAVSLAEARKARDAAEKVIQAGQDPIAARAEAKQDAPPEPKTPTFGDMADRYITAKESQWRNEKHRWQWRHTLETYAAPLRQKPVDAISTSDVLAVLTPLWGEKQETGARLRGRIELVLDAAQALGHIPEGKANPARWKGNLAHLLPKRQKLQRGHHPALPYQQIPAFMARLRERPATAARALEFCILTAARSGEVIGARFVEIDRSARVWHVPADRMKAGVAHSVPLCDRATAIIDQMAAVRRKDTDLIFLNRNGEALSDMAMNMLLRRMGQGDVTTHGFRSSFRDWAGDCTDYPREIAEAALAHVVGGVEGAYRRQTAIERRRALMQDWEAFCAGANGGAS